MRNTWNALALPMTSLEEAAKEYSSQFYGLPEDHSMRDFKSGASWQLKQLQSVGVEGARKVSAYHSYLDGSFTLSSSGSKNTPVEYIEALPVQALIASQQREIEELKESSPQLNFLQLY